MIQQHSQKRWSTVKCVPAQYPEANFTEGSIRWWIFNSTENGFNSCIVRIGRKVLIDLDKFEQWIENGGAAA